MGLTDVDDGTCVFCDIAQQRTGPPPGFVELTDFVAFEPLNPAGPGHTLVVPKVHVTNYWRLPTHLACSLALACHSLGRLLRQRHQPDGMNLITSDGAAASQTVPHLHMHLVPRWHGDRLGDIWAGAR